MSISLFNGLSGLSGHQKMLDVISNNIANLNTYGFKRSTMRMSEERSQTLQSSSAPTTNLGGMNPIQIGHGVRTSSIGLDFAQGTMESTGRALDIGIQGEGFFVLADATATKSYTRVGNFGLDSDSYLVDQATGYRVQSLTGDIRIQKDQPLPPSQTSAITMQGNLDPTTTFPGGDPVTTSINVLDSRGETHKVDLSLLKTGDLTWSMTASLPNADGTFTDNFVDGVTFNEDGSFAGVTGAGAGNNNITVTFNGLTTPQNITFDFGTIGGFNGLTQIGGDSTAAAVDQDGYTSGSLLGLSVNPDGTLVGQYSNGQIRNLEQIEIATFSNPEGLEKTHDNLYIESANSGQAVLGKGLSGRAGAVVGGSLEASNVDVSKEVALMIVAQRGFQVNARVITVSNEILQEVAGLVQ